MENTFSRLKEIISGFSKEKTFEEATLLLQKIIFAYTIEQLKTIIVPIGMIPETIEHDSTEEKLFAKAADIVLAKCFQELGLSSSVIKTRSNCADVIAKSKYHGYSLVGDAKTFRLSRTAKNQKDFKVESMVHWRGDCDYSVLVCPFFQYPRSHSQIYVQALQGNVLLFSWEHIFFLLDNKIRENCDFSLKNIWDMSNEIAKQFSLASRHIIYWDKQDKLLCKLTELSCESLAKSFAMARDDIVSQCKMEIGYYQRQIEIIEGYTREQAVNELIAHLKLHEKIKTIKSFIEHIS